MNRKNESKANFVKLQKDAQNVLSQNDKSRYTVPNLNLYPHQWLWDSCFIAIGLANYDIERAQIEILSLLEAQWHNGMMPNIILHTKSQHLKDHADRHSRIWRSFKNPNAPDQVETSGITQPPMLAEAIYKIGEKLPKLKRREWYKLTYPALLNYHQWLYKERDPHNEGLTLQIHPWEVGLDNTPPWMNELNDHLLPWWIRFVATTRLDNLIGWFRSDNNLTIKNERLTNVEALAFYSVQRRLRRKNYDFQKIIDHSLFAIEDITFNSILIRANYCLRQIANELEVRLPSDLIVSMRKSVDELDKLWDEYAEEYYSRDFISHRLLKTTSIGGLIPLYSGGIKKDRALRLVNSLKSERRFKSPYPVPSVPLDSNWFQDQRYWQGPTWINTNWLIIEGLKRYGFNDLAEDIRNSSIEMVQKSGFYEYFNPHTGEGLGSNSFAWSAALIIDLLVNF